MDTHIFVGYKGTGKQYFSDKTEDSANLTGAVSGSHIKACVGICKYVFLDAREENFITLKNNGLKFITFVPHEKDSIGFETEIEKIIKATPVGRTAVLPEGKFISFVLDNPNGLPYYQYIINLSRNEAD